MKTVVLSTHTEPLFRKAVAQAAESLRAGNAVALPTETVYGLAANAWDAEAVARLFEIKGRPAHNPIIVHIGSLEMARLSVSNWPATAEKLATAFWPGPLTLVLPRSVRIPDVVTAGGPTVGIRWPSHPFIQEVIRACGFPLAAPSANPAGDLSPTRAEHVAQGLGGKVPLVVDGGPAQVGIESTVLDLARQPARVLRPGMISMESLRAVLGGEGLSRSDEQEKNSVSQEALRSPGQLMKHYAPKAKLMVWGWRNDSELRTQLCTAGSQMERTYVIAHTHVPSREGLGGVIVIPHDPPAFARALYSELHRCDAERAEAIIIEALPSEPAWEAIADRLRRASAGK